MVQYKEGGDEVATQNISVFQCHYPLGQVGGMFIVL